MEALLACIRRNDRAGVEMIQIREKDLSDAELRDLVRAAVAVCRTAKVLVNGRIDIALECGAAGAHLPSSMPMTRDFRKAVPRGFLLGASCHDVMELHRAQYAGADFAVYGPVFTPLSKTDERTPVGLEGLRAACASAAMPVFALGGVTRENAAACAAAGAAGVAGITMFQQGGA
jgi:thiamine-phosphate pyrophosphorylase